MNPESWLRSRWALAAAAVLLTLLAWGGLVILGGQALDQVEEQSGDFIWRVAAKRQDERRLIIVDIDERSLQEIGPWPWPRSIQARLSQRLAEQGASLQILDLVFFDPRADDGVLASRFRETRPVLGQVFALEQGGEPRIGRLAGALAWPTCPAPFQVARGFLANVPGIVPGLVGHITPRISRDGVIRHQPAVICYDERAYPSLAISAFMQGAGVRQLSLKRGEVGLDPAWKLVGVPTLAEGIPLDDRGDMRVPWSLHPHSFVSVSAADVLAGRVPAGLLRNAWVLVGSTAFGLNDSIATPFSGAEAGLLVHAELLGGLIDGRIPYTPLAAPWYRAGLALLGLALLAGVSAWLRLPSYGVPLIALAWAGLLFGLHAFLLARHALWLGWLSPALYCLLLGFLLSLLEQARLRFERNRLYSHLSSYLPGPVAASLALQPPSSAIKAQRREISVLFADIRNFSAYCEARPSEESAGVLHAFFSAATQIIEAEGGMVESFQGDAVLAVWGANLSGKRDVDGNGQAEQALRAAVRLLEESRKFLPDPAPEGLEPLALGIGLENGAALVGSFGLARRRTHLAMGRTVTIASRLVQMTADLAHPILVGEGMAAQINSCKLESLGTFLLEGMRTPCHIYAYPLAECIV